MFKRISIFLIVLLTLFCFVSGVSATDPGLFIEKDAANTYIDYVDADGTSIMLIDDTDGVTIAVETVDTSYTSITVTSTTDASDLDTASIKTKGGIACTKQLYLGDDIDMSVNGTGVYDITLKDSVADALSIVGGVTDMMVFCTDTDTITIIPEVLFTDDIDLSTSTTGVYDLTLKDAQADALSIVAGTTDMVVFCTGTDTITITPPVVITGLVTSNGGIIVGVNGTGHDVQFFSATSGNHMLWDESADDLMLVGTDTQFDVAGTTDSTSAATGSIHTDGGLGVAKAIFVGGNISIATGKIITTTAELTLNSVDPLTVQFGGVDWLQMDEAAISSFAAEDDAAGHAVYIESEDGGVDGGTASTGMVGGAVSLKTGDGSAAVTTNAVGGAGGALSLITGIGLTGDGTGNGGVGGAVAITAGAGGDSGAGAGVGGTGGTITLTAGAGGGAGGGTAGAPGKVDIAAGLLHMGVQTIDMNDTTVVTTLVPGTPTGTLITGNIMYVDANGAGAEILKLPHEADADGVLLVVVNTGGETI